MFRKILLAIVLILVTGSMLLWSGPARAQAVRLTFDICFALGPDCAPAGAIDESVVSFEEDSASGNKLTTCKGLLPDGITPPTKAVHCNFENTGRPCQFFDGTPTTDWEEIITPSGRVDITCHLNTQK